MPPQPYPDQCALDKDGQLKDAKNILWFNSPSDKNTIPLPPVKEDAVTDVRGTICINILFNSVHLISINAQHYSFLY